MAYLNLFKNFITGSWKGIENRQCPIKLMEIVAWHCTWLVWFFSHVKCLIIQNFFTRGPKFCMFSFYKNWLFIEELEPLQKALSFEFHLPVTIEHVFTRRHMAQRGINTCRSQDRSSWSQPTFFCSTANLVFCQADEHKRTPNCGADW